MLPFSNAMSKRTLHHTGSTFLRSRLSSWDLSSTSGTQRVCTLATPPYSSDDIAFAAEQQGKIDVRTPAYVTRRGEAVAEVSEEQKQDV
jgi:hypothetical protein